MPTILNPNAISKPTAVPQFFDKELTGRGKTAGVLNTLSNPIHSSAARKPGFFLHNRGHVATTIKNLTSTTIPFYLINPVWLNPVFLNDMKLQEDDVEWLNDEKTLGIQLFPYCAELKKWTKTDTEPGGRSLDMCYHLRLIHRRDNSRQLLSLEMGGVLAQNEFDSVKLESTTAYYLAAVPTQTSTGNVTHGWQTKDWYLDVITCSPLEWTAGAVQYFKYYLHTDDIKLNSFFSSWSLYDAVCSAADLWQNRSVEILNELMDRIRHNEDAAKLLSIVFGYLETYPLPLEHYANIYKSLTVRYTPEQVKELCKCNLCLRLSNTLEGLDKNRALLHHTVKTTAQAQSNYSLEQKNAIESDEPLVIVQAGAGTGKSTTIGGRVRYLMDSKTAPEDILVISFTNNAADHIKEKLPGVKSMTIQSMIHQIYSLNNPGHQLSQPTTLINALEIYYPNHSIAKELITKMMPFTLSHYSQADYTELCLFTENNFDAVKSLLDAIGQTTLELEIIITYLKIKEYQEPDTVKSRHLIIDEVQDCSIFEFIFTLSYVEKNHNCLYMVGDSSQTLYAFRASDPKALNVLEGSDVFHAYKLQTNYRSNQEILDMANMFLRSIEANQFAKIQLTSNDLSMVTQRSFQEKVLLKHVSLKRKKDLEENLENVFNDHSQGSLLSYISSCLAKKEQVLFMAYSRKQVQMLQKLTESQFPQAKCVSLIPDRPYSSNIFSKFIKNYWNELALTTGGSITSNVQQAIYNHLDKLVYNPKKAFQSVSWYVQQWEDRYKASLDQQASLYYNRQITRQQFEEVVQTTMMTFEIEQNAAKMQNVSRKNNARKAESCAMQSDFLFSTVHSAKGLEFNHVVLLLEDDPAMSEEDKRLYYVALTRAEKSEFILSWSAGVPVLEQSRELLLNSYPL